MELWDVLDRNGVPTGRTMVRGARAAPGDYHLVVDVWIQDESDRWLVQHRADHLEWSPGEWAATGGSALAGEDSATAAIRETREEVGLLLSPHQLRLVARVVRPNRLNDVWLARVDNATAGRVRCSPEVAEVRWVTSAELSQLVASGVFHDCGPDYPSALHLG